MHLNFRYILLLLALVVRSWVATAADTLSVFLLGDVMMHQKQIEADYSTFFKHIESRMKAADLCIANMEFPLGGKPYAGYPEFSAPDAFARQVKNCGVDVFLVANNHITDRGEKGLKRTLGFYRDSLQIPCAGIDNAPLVLKEKGIRLALVNFTYGTNNGLVTRHPHVSHLSEKDIAEVMDSAGRTGADFIIALPHWGNEYETSHSPGQEKMARELIRKGADVIVGAHPHVVQDTAHIQGVPVLYSLGNAVSNMSARNTRLELAVTLRFVCENGEKRMLEPQLHWMWCTLPGRLTPSYATIFVEEWIGKRERWRIPADYDKMMETYLNIKQSFR